MENSSYEVHHGYCILFIVVMFHLDETFKTTSFYRFKHISIIVSGQNGVRVRRGSTWIAEQFGARKRIADMKVDNSAEALTDEVEDDKDCGNTLLQPITQEGVCLLAMLEF